MKINSSFKKSLAISGSVVAMAAAASAQDVTCDSALVPQVCRIFAGVGSFSVSGILQSVFAIIIAALVIFILFQIVKAVFEWVSKSGDEKARGAAIKSITSAIVAGIVLLVSILFVIVGASLLNIGTPAPYSCYALGTGGIASVTELNPRGTYSGTAREIPDVSAQEGTGSFNYWNPSNGNTAAPGKVQGDVAASLKKIKCMSNSGSNAGKEYQSQYIVTAKIGLTNTTIK